MASKASSLFKTLQLGDIQLANRIALAPLTRGRCGADQVPKAHNVEYYTQRASAGLLISEATAISPQGMGWGGAPALYTDAHTEGWKRVTEAVHKKDSRIFCQLWHMGRVTLSSYHGLQPVSSVAVACSGSAMGPKGKVPYEIPRALTADEIARVVEEFRHAAENAKKAGFDGVEIHGANGYLLDQFIQSTLNNRTDNYGGSIENRFRIYREVLQAVSTVFPSHRIGVRVSPNGMYNDMGSADNIETFSYAIAEFAKLNLGYVHVLDGLGFGFHKKCRQFTLKDARDQYKGVIIGNVGYTKETAEAAIDSGNADMISFGRPFISNPDLVERFKHGWKLNPDAKMTTYYSFPQGKPEVGYTDFPFHSA